MPITTPATTNIGFEGHTPKEVVEAIKPEIEGVTVCDVGCGTGEWMERLLKYASAVKGIEKSLKYEIAVNEGLDVVQGNATVDAIPIAATYYAWLGTSVLADFIENVETRGIKGTFIVGNYTDYFVKKYLESLGAVKRVVKTTRGDFTIWIWSIA